MIGAKNGVAMVIASKESGAIFSHYYGHALNLEEGDTIKNCQLMKFSLEVVAEIFKKSPKPPSEMPKTDLAPGFGFFVQYGGLCVQHLSRVYWTNIKYYGGYDAVLTKVNDASRGRRGRWQGQERMRKEGAD